jgi:hypothetical protein
MLWYRERIKIQYNAIQEEIEMKYKDGLNKLLVCNEVDNSEEAQYLLEVAYKQGYKHALEEAINIIFAFGPDEMDKKMRVRDLLSEVK